MMMTSFSIEVHSIMRQFRALISRHDFLNSITARTENSQFFCYHPTFPAIGRRSRDLGISDISVSAAAFAACNLRCIRKGQCHRASVSVSVPVPQMHQNALFFFTFFLFFCRLLLSLTLLLRLSIMEGFFEGVSGGIRAYLLLILALRFKLQGTRAHQYKQRPACVWLSATGFGFILPISWGVFLLEFQHCIIHEKYALNLGDLVLFH